LDGSTTRSCPRFLPEDAYVTGPVPLAGVALLGERSAAGLAIERLSPAAAVPGLVPTLIFGGTVYRMLEKIMSLKDFDSLLASGEFALAFDELKTPTKLSDVRKRKYAYETPAIRGARTPTPAAT
jgi:hypothetical protein